MERIVLSEHLLSISLDDLIDLSLLQPTSLKTPIADNAETAADEAVAERAPSAR